MARFAEPMSRLIDELRKLPGIGTKNAQRLAFHVLRSSDTDARALAEAILELRARLQLCSICNNITDVDPCGYCTSAVRDRHIVCVVEEPTNIATIEKTRSYNGVYHVLHGTLSPIGGVGPEQLRIANLLSRLAPTAAVDLAAGAETGSASGEDRDIREVILATSPTTEGEATAAYLAAEIHRAAPSLRVTRIAPAFPPAPTSSTPTKSP